MVKIENIKNIIRNGNNIISMDCYEEGDIERVHHVVFDVSTLEVISGLQNNIYVRQGIAKIWNYARKGLEIPEKTVSYWY